MSIDKNFSKEFSQGNLWNPVNRSVVFNYLLVPDYFILALNPMTYSVIKNKLKTAELFRI